MDAYKAALIQANKDYTAARQQRLDLIEDMKNAGTEDNPETRRRILEASKRADRYGRIITTLNAVTN